MKGNSGPQSLRSLCHPNSRLAVPWVQVQGFKGSSGLRGGWLLGRVSRGKLQARSDVIRRRFWRCRGCRWWPGCCAGYREWGQAMGGGSHQVCWRAAWGCWWWQRRNLVPHSWASGHRSGRSDWNDWRDTKDSVFISEEERKTKQCCQVQYPRNCWLLSQL